MHILFVTAEYPPMTGGVGAYTAELAKALAELGCRVSVLTSKGNNGNHDGTPVQLYPEVGRWDWRIWGRAGHQAQTVGVDWVHVQYQTGAYAMHPAINLAPWAWRQRRQGRRFCTAWTYHDLRVPYLFPKAGAQLRRWVTEFPALHSDLVVVTNEGDRLALAGRTVNLAKIPIGSNIQGSHFSPAEHRQHRAAAGYGENALVIGYFGFLNRSKGGLTLVRTLDQLVRSGRNAHLLMIGEQVGDNDPTNAAYQQEVAALSEQLGLSGRIRWTGHQRAEEVSAHLNLCDVLLMPYTDGASLRRGTLMAGLAHGCAIVTTMPLDPLPELVDGRDLLYVPVEDAQAAAQAVARIADDPALAVELRRNALTASVQFSWGAIAREHLHWYQRQADR